MTLEIKGFWLEDDAPKDEAFAGALSNGLQHFADMIGAKKFDPSGIKQTKLRFYLKKKIKL
jgi:hypothetical protein